jgi:very-short-patch-repair endonuclease
MNQHEQEFVRLWTDKTDIILYSSDSHRALPWRGCKRAFKCDFVEPLSKTLIEIQGGVFSTMGHSTGSGITRDAEKAILAQQNGWAIAQIPTHAYKKFIPQVIKLIQARIKDCEE